MSLSLVAAYLLAPLAAPQETETLVLAPRAESAATESAATVTVVTGEQLAATGERSLPRALGLAAGVWIQETNLGGGAPFVRGVTGNQVLILVDGVRVNDSTTRFGPNQSLNTIDPAIVERVEVLRGPSSVLYGSDAIGGVIRITTKRRRPIDAGGHAGLEPGVSLYYQDVTRGGRAALSLSGAAERDALLGIVSGQEWEDLEAGDGETQEFTGYGGGAGFAAWEHALGHGRSLRWHSIVNRDHDVPRTDQLVTGFGQTQPSSSQFEFELQERQAHVLTYTDEETGTPERMQARLYYRSYREDRERQGFGSSTQRFESDDVSTFGLGLDWRKALGAEQLLTFGFDVEHDRVDSTRVDVQAGVATPKDGEFAPDSRYTSFGAFVQDELFALAPWALTGGLRFSAFDFCAGAFPAQPGSTDEDGSFTALTASVAAARDVAQGVRLSATIAQGFRAPNLAELAKDGTFAGGVELHNPDLEPEHSLTYELALDAERGSWNAGIAAYYTDIEDIVGRELVDPGGPGVPAQYARENQGRVVLYGLEGELRRRLGAEGSPWSAAASASWTRGRQYDDTMTSGGAQPLYDVPWRRVPPLFGTARLRFDRGDRRPVRWAELALHLADEQDELHPDDLTDPRIDPNGTPAWATLNLDLGGSLGADASWSAGLHNALDERYRVHGSGFDAPGRGFVVTLDWRP